VIPQHLGRPDSKLRAAEEIDAIADPDDHIEVVQIHLAQLSICGNLCIFCTN
jgi:hypothetical protein